jgi:lipoyl(octanoyl) transferase
MYKLIKCEGLIKYRDGLQMQLDAFEKVKNAEYEGILIILEHEPVYTI